MQKLLYGVAYYDEYMPYDRLDADIRMMLAAGINVVRIAESTWSTHEPQNGVFDFRSVDRVLDAMHQAGISVIIGTPTYAVPTWMAKQHPDVLAITPQGQAVHYYFNYSDHPGAVSYPYADGREVLADTPVASGQNLPIAAWGVLIIVEQ